MDHTVTKRSLKVVSFLKVGNKQELDLVQWISRDKKKAINWGMESSEAVNRGMHSLMGGIPNGH